jgi:hypothetical protein
VNSRSRNAFRRKEKDIEQPYFCGGMRDPRDPADPASFSALAKYLTLEDEDRDAIQQSRHRVTSREDQERRQGPRWTRWTRWISRARFETKVQRAEPRSCGVHRNAMQAA